MHPEEFVPNERLRRARILKGWSQAELAEEVGTSFEMVSRWERGVTIPSPRYRKQLCAILGKSAEELGLMRDPTDPLTQPPSPLVLLASSYADAEKAIVSHLKTILHERGISLWSSRKLGRQVTDNSRTVLREVVQVAQVILVIVSPEARSSRHVRDAFEMARLYRRPVCGVWIEGEHWERCLPEGHVELAALIDARERDNPAMLEETARTLAHLWRTSQNGTELAAAGLPDRLMEAIPLVTRPTEISSSMHPSEQLLELVPPPGQVAKELPSPRHSLKPTTTAKPISAAPSHSATPPILNDLMGLSRIRAARQQQKLAPNTARLLIGLAIVLIGGTLLGSIILLAEGALLGSTILLAGGALLGSTVLITSSRRTATIVSPIRGGTWTYGLLGDVPSLIPNGTNYKNAAVVDQALYLPLFYGDAQGVIHAGAATEVPTIQNGGVSADATTWTFHLRPGLVWSDGQPYDARDVDFTWRLWAVPKFGAASILGLNLIRSTEVSADHLSITFHLKQPFAPFLANLWVDGIFAPLPAHHFSTMDPEQILKSSENLNPKVTSGPFMMSGSVPGDYYTLVRNPKYYLTWQGLPYLDKVVFDVIEVVTGSDLVLKQLQEGSLDATGQHIDPQNFQAMQHLKDYSLVYPPTQNSFEALYFNFHNTVLSNHPEVRQAMAMAVDQQTIIAEALKGIGTPICTDHPSAYHPGFDPNAPCPLYNLEAANKLLDDHGWVRGPDGVRAKDDHRLEFEYSTALATKASRQSFRPDIQSIVQRDFGRIGIKLHIQNYPGITFFGSFLNEGKASPRTGAVAGRYDIAEYTAWLYYDADDSSLFACNQFPSATNNFSGLNTCFYCNPALDKLFAQEQATIDPWVRQQIFTQIHQIYLTQFPFIVLCGLTEFALAHKRTHNYLPGPYTDTYNIAEWWCDNGKC
jgi:peptide/nickel transport system substrate-binding protein